MACFCIVYELRIFFTFLKCCLKKQAFATKTVYGPQSLKHILSSLCRKSLWAPWTINKTKPKSNLNLLLLFSRSVMADSFETPWTVAHQFLCPWDFPGKNTGVGYHFLLQGGFSWPRDQTHISCISCIGRQILYHWATWEAQSYDQLWPMSCEGKDVSKPVVKMSWVFWRSHSLLFGLSASWLWKPSWCLKLDPQETQLEHKK